MEHLTLPKYRPNAEQALIPYVCEKPYDNGEFLSYPVRENILFAILSDEDQRGFRHKERFQDSKEQVYSFLQSWLFFGLIYEILGQYVDRYDLVRDNEDAGTSSKVLSTTVIPDAVQQWVEDVKARPTSSRPSYEHISRCLRLTFTNLEDGAPEIDQDWVVCLASLAEMLSGAVNEAFGGKEGNENRCPSQWHSLVRQSYWEERMTASRLCPSQVGMILKTALSIHTLYFTSHLLQPTPLRRHDQCSEYICNAYQCSLGDYQTRHVTSQCDCGYLAVELGSLTDILNDGHLPLLRIKPGRILAELSVDIVSTRDCPKYLALSHVWADGLGNPRENALPRCQLDFLRETMDSLRPRLDVPEAQEILLWCDTLCCPAAEGTAKDLALLQMKKTYLEASCVLVLSHSLRQFNINELEIDEAAMRIFTSGWFRRLWTLQETALSLKGDRLWFQFGNGFLHVRPLLRGIYHEFTCCVSRKGLASHLIKQSWVLLAFHNPDAKGLGVDLPSVAVGLRYRAVSVATDEPLLIANLLHLDAAHILGCSSIAQRMQRLWTLMPKASRGIPATIIFWLGPRLNIPGFRWAPATLLVPSTKNEWVIIPNSMATSDGLDERGLRVSFPGRRVSRPQRSRIVRHLAENLLDRTRPNHLFVRGEDGRWYNLFSRCTAEVEGFLPCEDLYTTISVPNLWLIHMPLSHVQDEFREPNSENFMLGLLAKETGVHDRVTYVQSMLNFMLLAVEKSWAPMLDAAYHASEVFPSEARRRLAQLDDASTELETTARNAAIEIIAQEAEELAGSADPAIVAIASQRTPTRDGPALLRKLIVEMVYGIYGCLGPTTGETQQWCVD